MLLAASLAVQVTVVVPRLNDEPDWGVHATVGDAMQLSVAVGE